MESLVRRIVVVACVGMSLTVSYFTVAHIADLYPPEDGLVLANDTIAGGDFVAYWLGGHLYIRDPSTLYDLDNQQIVRQDLLGESDKAVGGDLPFVYPPLVAVLMAPLSRLSLPTAYYLFTAVGIVATFVSLLVLVRQLGLLRWWTILAIVPLTIGYAPYGINTVVGGQWPWLGVTILALVASAILAGRDRTSGLLLSLTYYKPPLFVVALLVLLIARGRRLAAGFIAGASVLLALTIWFVGFGGAWSYLSLASSYTYGQRVGSTALTLPPEKGMGLVAAVFSFTGSMVLTGALLIPPAALRRMAERRANPIG